MKNFFNTLASPFIYLKTKILQLLGLLGRIWSPIAKYGYEASDLLVRNIIEGYGRFLKRFAAYRENHNKSYFLALFRHMVYIFLAVMVLIIISINYLFIVPVGSSAVITRFGQYVREVESGLNFIFPVVERYYIVNTGNLFEETFGFRQGTEVFRKAQFDEQEQFVLSEYEAQVLQAELDANQAFSSQGDFFTEMNRRQRLTHDYVRRNLAPPADMTNDAILARLQQKQETIQQLRSQNISPDGKIPVPGEMKFLTGDLSLVLLQWTLQYHISSGPDYLFNSRDVQQNVHDIAFAMMNEVIGETPFHLIVTTGRRNIEMEVMNRTQEFLDRFNVGVQVTQVIILNALPPEPVVFAFNEVNKAAQDLERFTYQGEYEYMTRIPKARGKAKRVVAEAQAYATKIINEAQGQAGRFSMVNKAYLKAPAVTADRLYIDAMESILKATPNVILDKDAKGVLPLILSGGRQGAAAGSAHSSSLEQQLTQLMRRMGLPTGSALPATGAAAQGTPLPSSPTATSSVTTSTSSTTGSTTIVAPKATVHQATPLPATIPGTVTGTTPTGTTTQTVP